MRLLTALVLAVLASSSPSFTQRPGAPSTLANDRLEAAFSNGRLVSLRDLRSNRRLDLADERYEITLNGARLDPGTTPVVQARAGEYNVIHALPGATVTVRYELRAGWGFLSKRIRIESTSPTFQVNEVVTLQATLAPGPASVLPLSDGKFGTLLRLPGATNTSVFVLHQNPFNAITISGSAVRAGYSPNMAWNQDYGPFESARLLIGLVEASGRRIPARSVPEWVHVADYDRYLRENPAIDEAESDALVEAVRAFLLYRPSKSVRVHVPWTENDYQIDVATRDGWAEYQRIFEMAKALGATHSLFTAANANLSSLAENRDGWGWENLLFFSLGQRLRKGEWVPERDPVPAPLQPMLDDAAKRGVKLLAYAYPTLPFLQDPAWTAWAGGKVGGYRGVDTGQRSFQDWWVRTLVAFMKRTGAAGFSFDHWWIAYDDPAATSQYAQWYGARRILEELRRQAPDVVIDGRQQYMNFGPWTWLAGSYPHPTLTDEQPESFLAFPDLHTDRVSANRQRFAAWKYRVERFTPPEIMPGYITHQTERTDEKNVMRRDRFRPRDWDVLGWKYSLFSSIGTAPFNHTISYVPARDEDEFRALGEADKAFFRRWLDWTDTHASVLRRLKPILGPPMIGSVDGTAAFEGGRGFVFLFNPNYRALDARLRLDASIGASGSRFLIRELHPEEGRLIGKPGAGVWSVGDDVVIPMRATEALVLEVTPAPAAVSRPMLFNVNGQVALTRGTIAVTSAAGEPGTTRRVEVLLPSGTAPSTLTVNGRPVPFTRHESAVSADIAFAGARFGRAENVLPYDPGFAGGMRTGAFVIPARVFEQLKARRAGWPVPYTADDLRAPWLGSDRLLLFLQMAEPTPDLAATLTIDGQPVPLVRAYNSIYGHSPQRTFLGWYADVSSLAPGVEHRVELKLPVLPPGRFQGLFFDNVEPEFTTSVTGR